MAKFNQPPPIKDNVVHSKNPLSTDVWRRWFQGIFTNALTKADIPDGAIEDNVVSFDDEGNLKDSGIAAADVLEPDDVSGTTDQITVTDNGDGTITISFPNPIVTPGPVTVTGQISTNGGNAVIDGTVDCDSITVDSYERHIQIPAVPSGTVANQATGNTAGTAVGLQFASTPDKYCGCQWEIPDDWVGGEDVYIEIDWMPDSGAMSGTDTVQWVLEYRSIAEGELVTQGTVATVTVTNSDDNAQYKTIHSRFTLDWDHADQPLTKQDHMYFLLHRNTGVANDFSGTVTATAFEIIYNSNTLPTSN